MFFSVGLDWGFEYELKGIWEGDTYATCAPHKQDQEHFFKLDCPISCYEAFVGLRQDVACPKPPLWKRTVNQWFSINEFISFYSFNSSLEHWQSWADQSQFSYINVLKVKVFGLVSWIFKIQTSNVSSQTGIIYNEQNFSPHQTFRTN